jgi:FkbM family methyltransferase
VAVLPNSSLSLTDGLQPLINPLRGLAILDPRPSAAACQCGPLTHWQADHAILFCWMLRDRAEVHEVALSDASGRGTLYVPLSDQGVLLHLAGSLKRSHFQFRNIKTYDVEIRTLDEVGLAGVRFVKADVEGGEREVLDGARATIARDRPIILLELLSGTHDNPAAETAAICETFGYEAFIVQRGEKIAALPAITALGKNTSWGTDIESRNVLFLPR